MADIISPTPTISVLTPTTPNTPVENKSKRQFLPIVITALLAFSLGLNIAQSLGLSLDTLKFKKYQNLAISPDNPNLIRYGMTYYLEGQIKEVKNEGDNLEIITSIKDLPKIYVDPKTNILTKNGDRYDTATKDQITPGKRVNLLLFNISLKEWYLSRIVLLP